LPPGKKTGDPFRRQQNKKQVTVRIDSSLLANFMPVAQARSLTLTDAVEEGLWLWLRENERDVAIAGPRTRLRLLTKDLDQQRQKLVTGFLVFISHPRESELEELFRNHLERFFDAFAQDKAFIDGLQRLTTIFPAPTAHTAAPPAQSL